MEWWSRGVLKVTLSPHRAPLSRNRASREGGVGREGHSRRNSPDVQRFRMAGVRITHYPGSAIGDQVKGRGQHRRAGVFENRVKVAFELGQELTGISGDRFEVLD